MAFNLENAVPFGLLATLLSVAVVTDLRSQRIPNSLTYGGVVTGLVLQAALNGWAGVLSGVIGMACAPLPMLAMWALGGTSAGDVKLMAVVGAFLGGKLALLALIATLLLGGGMGLVFMLYQARKGTASKGLRMPYAPAIALGSGAAVWFAALQ